MVHRVRLDKLLVERGYFESREKAQEAVLKGSVEIPGKGMLKPSTLVEANAPILIKQKEKFVSRGGYKLEKAIACFQINVHGLDCLDVGSSTGGFVDCLLQHGAKRVIALDVGRSLLHPSLSSDRRVHVIEKFNARYLTADILPFLPDLITVDVSFISVKKIFPALLNCFKEGTESVILIKPQFEAGRKFVRKGLVRDSKVHESILKDFRDYFSGFGFNCFFTFSPIKGAKGNIEYLCYLTRKTREELKHLKQIDKIVEDAFSFLGKS